MGEITQPLNPEQAGFRGGIEYLYAAAGTLDDQTQVAGTAGEAVGVCSLKAAREKQKEKNNPPVGGGLMRGKRVGRPTAG